MTRLIPQRCRPTGAQHVASGDAKASGQRPGRGVARSLAHAIPTVQQVRNPRATRTEGLVRRSRGNRRAHAVDTRVGTHEANIRRVTVQADEGCLNALLTDVADDVNAERVIAAAVTARTRLDAGSRRVSRAPDLLTGRATWMVVLSAPVGGGTTPGRATRTKRVIAPGLSATSVNRASRP